MVKLLHEKGISDKEVLAALLKVPRHLLLDASFIEKAYDDKPFQIGFGQTISQPYTVARQSELLKVAKGMKVLEVGTGSAYQALILEAMGARVYSIERFKELHLRAKKNLQRMGKSKIQLFFGDGFAGLPNYAPFDRILITAAAPHIPKDLLEQLKPGGRMVIPLGAGKVQKMTIIDKDMEGELLTQEEEDYKFVPMLKGKAFDK